MPSVRGQNRSTSHLSTILIPEWDRPIISRMRVIAKRTLRQFWESASQYADAKGPLDAWYAEARNAQWRTPQGIKTRFRQASILKNNRVVFNIGGNKYRLITAVDYQRQVLFVRFIGTHAQYDTIDAEVV